MTDLTHAHRHVRLPDSRQNRMATCRQKVHTEASWPRGRPTFGYRWKVTRRVSPLIFIKIGDTLR